MFFFNFFSLFSIIKPISKNIISIYSTINETEELNLSSFSDCFLNEPMQIYTNLIIFSEIWTEIYVYDKGSIIVSQNTNLTLKNIIIDYHSNLSISSDIFFLKMKSKAFLSLEVYFLFFKVS